MKPSSVNSPREKSAIRVGRTRSQIRQATDVPMISAAAVLARLTSFWFVSFMHSSHGARGLRVFLPSAVSMSVVSVARQKTWQRTRAFTWTISIVPLWWTM